MVRELLLSKEMKGQEREELHQGVCRGLCVWTYAHISVVHTRMQKSRGVHEGLHGRSKNKQMQAYTYLCACLQEQGCLCRHVCGISNTNQTETRTPHHNA